MSDFFSEKLSLVYYLTYLQEKNGVVPCVISIQEYFIMMQWSSVVIDRQRNLPWKVTVSGSKKSMPRLKKI